MQQLKLTYKWLKAFQLSSANDQQNNLVVSAKSATDLPGNVYGSSSLAAAMSSSDS